MTTRLKLLLLLVIVVAPILVIAGTAEVSFVRAQRTDFCASCHVMTGHVDDMRDPDSLSLASQHYRNRWINDDQCYRCHTDYDFMGPVDAKIRGLRHIVAYYAGTGEKDLALYEPYDFANCLACHGGTPGFVDNPIHESVTEDIAAGETSCLDCHGDAHTPREEP